MSADLAVGSRHTQLVIGSPCAGSDAGADAVAPETLPRWRALLELHWRARLERVTELSLAYHDAQEAGGRPRDGQPADAARARPLLRQAVAERRALADIEAALSRLANGRFGRCERCGEVVPTSLLTRTPQVRYCGPCGR